MNELNSVYDSANPTDAEGILHAIHNLSRVGVAAGDSLMGVDTAKAGNETLFEVIGALAKDAIDTLLVGSEPQGAGDVVEQFKTWQAAKDAYNAKCKQPDFDSTPETVAEFKALEVMSRQIANTAPATNADAAATLDWLLSESDGMSIIDYDMHIPALRAVQIFLKGV